MDTKKLQRIPPPVWALAAGVVQLAVTSKRMPWRRELSATERTAASAVSTVAGFTLAASSVALGVTSVRGFVRHQTTFDPAAIGESSALVTDGPNAYTRNPMYLALAGGLVSFAILRRSVLALIPVAGYIAAVDQIQIPVEEAGLRATFGEEYEAYIARVPRWIGFR